MNWYDRVLRRRPQLQTVVEEKQNFNVALSTLRRPGRATMSKAVLSGTREHYWLDAFPDATNDC